MVAEFVGIAVIVKLSKKSVSSHYMIKEVYTYCDKCNRLGTHKVSSIIKKDKWLVYVAKCSFCNEEFEACYIAER
jgi:MinD superfamily P-loop ATPase